MKAIKIAFSVLMVSLLGCKKPTENLGRFADKTF